MLIASLITFFYVPRARCEQIAPSVTGIPVEYLFASIGALVGLIYHNIRRDIRTLLHEGKQRSRQIRHIENAVRILCNHAHVNYRESSDE